MRTVRYQKVDNMGYGLRPINIQGHLPFDDNTMLKFSSEEQAALQLTELGLRTESDVNLLNIADIAYHKAINDNQSAPSLLAYLHDHPFVMHLLQDIQDLQRQFISHDNRLSEAYSAVMEAVMEHDGCANGKQEFVEAVGVPESMWPTREVTVEFSRTYEVGCFSDDSSIIHDAVSELIDDDDTSLSELSWSVSDYS